MKLFTITIPTVGRATFEVKAEDLEDAIDRIWRGRAKIIEEVHGDLVGEVEEWEINEGGVQIFHGGATVIGYIVRWMVEGSSGRKYIPNSSYLIPAYEEALSLKDWLEAMGFEDVTIEEFGR